MIDFEAKGCCHTLVVSLRAMTDLWMETAPEFLYVIVRSRQPGEYTTHPTGLTSYDFSSFPLLKIFILFSTVLVLEQKAKII